MNWTIRMVPELVKTRKGFICAMRLEDFSSGRVRPHEKTFQAIKDERLALMHSLQGKPESGIRALSGFE